MQTKILYAEDEAVLAALVNESLVKEGFEVRHASNGKMALDLLDEFLPDICILDVMMPVMDGFALSKQIRQRLPNIPIIFLTAKQTTEDVLEGFSSGGNDYIRKPFSLPELHARIRNLLALTDAENSGNSATHIYTIGTCQYDERKQLLLVGEEEYSLSYREHELLMLFIYANQSVVPRKKILKTIWGDDSFFNSRNLDVYIRKLRTYFKADESIQIITLKGVGYRFVSE